MFDYAMVSKIGGRQVNEDYVTMSVNDSSKCFVVCDGLGGHESGEIASKLVGDTIAKCFEEKGDYPMFLDDAFNMAQDKLLELQRECSVSNGMKTTVAALVVTDEQMKWAHIGDSRVYHIFGDGSRYERTKDHSIVQQLLDSGEITDADVRKHDDRNKLLRAMGTVFGKKSFDKSAILERDGKHQFVLMTDGFWVNILENEMLECLNNTKTSEEWLAKMADIVEGRLENNSDNYSAICVRVE